MASVAVGVVFADERFEVDSLVIVEVELRLSSGDCSYSAEHSGAAANARRVEIEVVGVVFREAHGCTLRLRSTHSHPKASASLVSHSGITMVPCAMECSVPRGIPTSPDSSRKVDFERMRSTKSERDWFSSLGRALTRRSSSGGFGVQLRDGSGLG